MTLRDLFLLMKVDPQDVWVGFPQPNGPAYTALAQETTDYLLNTEIPTELIKKEIIEQ